MVTGSPLSTGGLGGPQEFPGYPGHRLKPPAPRMLNRNSVADKENPVFSKGGEMALIEAGSSLVLGFMFAS